MLTICIPTYNRNDLLNQCLAKLLPQLGSDHRLIVIDNCSDVPVQNSLGNMLDQCEASEVRIVRNAVNLGGVGNILRSLELCETNWLYCLGDDDLVAPDCILKIEHAIAIHSDALYISFSRTSAVRSAVVRTDGMNEFISNFDDWNTFLFMSTSVVNAGAMRDYIRWGYLYSYSWAPFQAILLKILNNGGSVIFSSDVICIEESRADETWVPFPVVAGKMILPELIEDDFLRKKFARRLVLQTPILSHIYWARVGAKNSADLEKFKMYVNLYIDRRGFYEGLISMLIMRGIAFIFLSKRLIPTPLFNAFTYLSFKFLNRQAPSQRKFDYRRT